MLTKILRLKKKVGIQNNFCWIFELNHTMDGINSNIHKYIKISDKMETHKIISGSLGLNVSGTPVILQTSLNNIG